MKRKVFIHAMLIVLTLCLAFPMGVMAKMSVKTKTKKAKACYEIFLNTSNAGGIPKHYLDTYDIIDVNGDKVPELLYASYGTYKVYIFRYNASKNKIEKVKSCMVGKALPEIYYNKKKHMVCLVKADTAGSTFITYKFKGNKLKKVDKITYVNILHGGPTYKCNGKKISEKTWNNKINRIKKKYKTLRYKVYG